MPLPTLPIAWRAVLAVLLIGCSWLAFDPNPPPAADVGWDKLNHALAFAALTFSARQGFSRAGAGRIVPALLGYGILIELVQSQIPARSADPADVLGDAVGIAAGWLLVAAWRRLARR
jgi:VanZ family protein